MSTETHSQLANFIWSICNLLRGPYKRNEYRKVILPLTVLRRFDCLVAPTRAQVLKEHAAIKAKPENVVRSLLEKVTGRPFYNFSKLDFARLLDDPNQLAPNLNAYINGFSKNVRDIMERFALDQQISRMAEKNLLYEVIKAFAKVDLAPERVDNVQMGYVFEELIRISAEQSNEEAGEHFTPREVIRLMVNLLLSPEKDLRRSHVVKTIYDPACGTGGMLSVSEKYIRDLNADANPLLFGQDWNDEAWAVCKSDMLIKGDDADNIVRADTFTKDGFDRDPDGKKIAFDYMLANPPFGVEWKQQQRFIEQEHNTFGYDGRFGAGLPRINDGSLLFLQHMLSKMRARQDGGSRIGIVFNGSPLFTGDAGSGESNIRQWIIENEDDPELPKKKATRALAKFMVLHPYNIEPKTEVMVEHFRRSVKHWLGGKAKAMVVTSSRLHAVRYMLAFQRYIAENGYTDIHALVAFSGTVNDPDTGQEYTEPGMNPDVVTGKPISEMQLPGRFESPDHQILLVANKYQTGFDQPLLHTMHVDKRLDGVQAVQTLSRLNRMIPGKDAPFVLDFVNDAENIFRAFKPYYDKTGLQQASDPSKLETLKHELDQCQVYHWSEVEAFAQIFYKPAERQNPADHAHMQRHLQPAVDRFKSIAEDDKRQEFREGRAQYLKSPTEVGTGKPKDVKAPLSEIIDVLNERFGTQFTEEDRLFFQQIKEKACKSEQVVRTALANPLDKFELGIRKLIEDFMIERMADNDKIVTRYMADRDFQASAFPILAREIFDTVRGSGDARSEASVPGGDEVG